MTKDILVSISGLQMAVGNVEGNDDEPIEVLSAGSYYFKNGKNYVLFEEAVEGMQGVIKTQIKWKGTEVLEVTKKGLSNVNMIFEKNKNNRCYYNTPFGQLNMGIYTTDIYVDESEDNINIRAEYALDVDYEPIAECVIRINICPRESKNFSMNQKMTF